VRSVLMEKQRFLSRGLVLAYSLVRGARLWKRHGSVLLRGRRFHRSVSSHVSECADSAEMFTTSQWEFKYRPLYSVLNLVTSRIGGGSAVAYRIRNLVFHLANILLLYCLSRRCSSRRGESRRGSAVRPASLANQSVIGATWTQTADHFFPCSHS